MKFSKKLFYFLVLLLPINLGKHFVLKSSYVQGLLIDYLIPTIFVQDILIVLVIVAFVIELVAEKKVNLLSRVFESKTLIALFLFVFACFLSVLGSGRIFPSLASFAHLFLGFLLCVYMYLALDFEKDFKTFIRVSAVSVCFISMIGILQFIKQDSLFSNYLFFGEQPNPSYSYGVTRENVSGVAKIPAYSLFRHPNTFAGYLAVMMGLFVMTLVSIQRSEEFIGLRFLLLFAFVLGLIALISTFSMVAFLSLCFILFLDRVVSKTSKPFYNVLFWLLIAVPLLLPLFKNLPSLATSPSVFRRVSLLEAAYGSIKEKPLFGVGYGTATASIEKYVEHSQYSHDIRLNQPPHNIFALIFMESGVFALGFLVFVLLFSSMRLLSMHGGAILTAALFQILLLGSLDHYFFTSQQTLYILFLLFGWFSLRSTNSTL